jgi:hypothetical protein
MKISNSNMDKFKLRKAFEKIKDDINNLNTKINLIKTENDNSNEIDSALSQFFIDFLNFST